MSVKKRTRVQKNALVRFWRRQEQFHLGKENTPTLYFSGKKVVKKSSISAVVANTFDQAKSGGGKKLRDRAASSYSELSEKKKYYKLRTTIFNTVFSTRGLRTTRLLNPLQQTEHVRSQHQVRLILLISVRIPLNTMARSISISYR